MAVLKRLNEQGAHEVAPRGPLVFPPPARIEAERTCCRIATAGGAWWLGFALGSKEGCV